MADSAAEDPQRPDDLRRLSDALWGGAEDEFAHDECRAALPELIEAEAAGEDAAGMFPRVQRHLDHCAECGQEYAMLVDLELADRAGELAPAPEPAPPGFYVQDARAPALRTIVVGWTRTLVAMLAPAKAGDVDRAADRFFAALAPRQALESRAPYGEAVGLENDRANPAYMALAAGYATTQGLMAQVSRQELNDWLAQNRLGAELKMRAEATARRVGFEADRAQAFGRAFAEVVLRDPEGLGDLLGS